MFELGGTHKRNRKAHLFIMLLTKVSLCAYQAQSNHVAWCECYMYYTGTTNDINMVRQNVLQGLQTQITFDRTYYKGYRPNFAKCDSTNRIGFQLAFLRGSIHMALKLLVCFYISAQLLRLWYPKYDPKFNTVDLQQSSLQASTPRSPLCPSILRIGLKNQKVRPPY